MTGIMELCEIVLRDAAKDYPIAKSIYIDAVRRLTSNDTIRFLKQKNNLEVAFPEKLIRMSPKRFRIAKKKILEWAKANLAPKRVDILERDFQNYGKALAHYKSTLNFLRNGFIVYYPGYDADEVLKMLDEGPGIVRTTVKDHTKEDILPIDTLFDILESRRSGEEYKARQGMILHRKLKNISQSEMAEKIGISTTLLSMIESGEYTTPGIAQRIAKAYGLDESSWGYLTDDPWEYLVPINRRPHGDDYDPDRYVHEPAISII